MNKKSKYELYFECMDLVWKKTPEPLQQMFLYFDKYEDFVTCYTKLAVHMSEVLQKDLNLTQELSMYLLRQYWKEKHNEQI